MLLCEADAKGSLAAALGVDLLDYTPREIRPKLSAMAMNTEDSLREYLRLFVKVPFVGRIGPLARSFDFVAQAAPGVREILVVGKLCHEVRERRFDLVVVDAPASGHVVGQIAAPRVLAGFARVGMVREQVGWMSEILEDPARTATVVVTTPEEMPVAETLELVGRLDREAGVALGAVVANRVIDEPFHRRDAAVFDALVAGPALERLRRVAGDRVDDVVGAVGLAVGLRRRQAEQLSLLRAGLPAHADVLNVAELDPDDPVALAGRVAAALAEELA